MKTYHNISLKPFNTFGIDVKASLFYDIQKKEELHTVLSQHERFFVLGGGSNMLLLSDIKVPVLHINTRGKDIIKETSENVWVRAAAGENWHEFVMWCLERDYGGVENLALIPGNVGTAPIQNIGAYGVEVKDVIERVYYTDITSGGEEEINNKECRFAYRDSIFKNELKGGFIITDVLFKLTKKQHKLHLSYGAIQRELAALKIAKPRIQDVAQAVIAIRREKLPDPKEIGNSGSFFKNPIVTTSQFEALNRRYPDMPHYPVLKDERLIPNSVKLAAGWLIDQCGFKGYRKGDAGVHKHQALVLVNYGMASGKDILDLAYLIQEKVKTKFGVSLEMEVNIMH